MEPWPSDVQLFQPYEVRGEHMKVMLKTLFPVTFVMTRQKKVKHKGFSLAKTMLQGMQLSGD